MLCGVDAKGLVAWHLYIWEHHYPVPCAAGSSFDEVLGQSSSHVQGEKTLCTRCPILPLSIGSIFLGRYWNGPAEPKGWSLGFFVVCT